MYSADMYSAEMNTKPKNILKVSSVQSDHGTNYGFSAGVYALRAVTLAMISALLLLLTAASPAQAQTETVLYNFAGGRDGVDPESNLISDGTNIFGTTLDGGMGYGTVFELSPNGSGGWNETILHRFTGKGDGEYPTNNLIFDAAGNLYGAAGGGTHGYGVVFKLSPMGGSWKETTAFTFSGAPGPPNGIVMDAAGNIYGTAGVTSEQGLYVNSGSVFELVPARHGFTLQVIYSDSGKQAVTSPGLTMDAAGNIFAVVASKVVELSPSGGSWTSTVLYPITGAAGYVSTPVLDQAGNVYGTTESLGTNGHGKVYKLTYGKNGKWALNNLYSFCRPDKCYDLNGYQPLGQLLLDAAGNIYGTTTSGGEYNNGTVFELAAPVGKGSYAEKILWNFNGTDGANPFAGLIADSAGNLYGTTAAGGPSGNGVVFELTP